MKWDQQEGMICVKVKLTASMSKLADEWVQVLRVLLKKAG